MQHPISVKVGSRNRITLPLAARERLGVGPGDRLIIDVQDGILILLPEPKDYLQHMEGLHKEIWHGVDTDAYLCEERQAHR